MKSNLDTDYSLLPSHRVAFGIIAGAVVLLTMLMLLFAYVMRQFVL